MTEVTKTAAAATFDFSPGALAEGALQAQLVQRCRRSLGHELNNAVQALHSGVEILTKALQPDVPRRIDPEECAALLKQQLANLQRTLGKLLDEVAPQPTAAATFDLVQLLREVLVFLAHEQAVARAELELPSHAAIVVDHAVLRRVLLSCILDALDRMGSEGSLAIGITRADSMPDAVTLTLRVTVAATAPRAPLTDRHQLGEILHRLMSRAGGSLEFTDTAAGYLINIHCSIASTTPHQPIDAAASNAVSSRPETQRALIVDSNRDAADTLALLLELEGSVAKAVYTGAQAMASIDEYHPSVVLIDIDSPGLDGNAIAQNIRAAARHQPNLVALLPDAQGKQRGTPAAHFDASLVKPVEWPALRDLIARLPPR